MSKFLVSWSGMLKGSKEPLPLRPFDTRLEAEAYRLGCADVVCILQQNQLELSDVIKDFIITEGEN
tara:strand:+ start:6631 stop:6828 length:198 start_codon:yes stop_codon:yes gene_type:complete